MIRKRQSIDLNEQLLFVYIYIGYEKVEYTRGKLTMKH